MRNPGPEQPTTPLPPPRSALSAPVTAAVVLSAVQGAFGVLVGLFLVGRGRRIRRLGIGMSGARLRGLGLVVLVIGAALIVVAVGLAQLRPWARIGGYVLEGITTVSNLLRLGGARPGAALAALVVSVVVIALLSTASARTAFSPAKPPP
jgi:hypothetical protein